MNENFKNQLAAFAWDLKAICDEHPDTCQYCPLTDADGYCKGGLLNSVFDPEAVIAAVEAYRKRKKPCAEVIDRALDVYTIEVEIDYIPKGCYVPSATDCSEKLRKQIEWYYGYNKWATVRVLSAKRFVLESHKEEDRESDREDAE